MDTDNAGAPGTISALRVMPRQPANRPGLLEQRVKLNRPAIYDSVMRRLAYRVDAAHRKLIRDGDVLPQRLPPDRALKPDELDELTWRVYCLSTAMRLSFVRCHPSVVLMAAEWWGSEEPSMWEWFCQAHWS